MTRRRSDNALAWLSVALLAVSLLFTWHLQLMEYVRIAVLGATVLFVFIALPRSFHKRFATRALLAGSCAYLLYLLDPAVNSVTLLDDEPQLTSLYRGVSFLFLMAGVLLWVTPRAMGDVDGGRHHWWTRFTRADAYVVVVVGGLAVSSMLLEVLRAVLQQKPALNPVLRGTKALDCLIVYFLLLRGAFHEPPPARRRIRLVLLSFLIFCACATMVGGIRALRAYLYVRLPANAASLPPALADNRQRLMRVFSLNAQEAKLVYEAGYAAGRGEWTKAQERLTRARRFPTAPVEEALLDVLLNKGDLRGALAALDARPPGYRFASLAITSSADRVAAMLRGGTNDPALYYLTGRLLCALGQTNEACNYFADVVDTVPGHANATFFLGLFAGMDVPSNTVLQMPAEGWLYSITPGKGIEEGVNGVTLLYNQTVRGMVWLPTGMYDAVIWARDAGTAPAATGAAFDPACKVRVWFGRALTRLRVIAPDRSFQPYTVPVEVRRAPLEVLVQFTNDVGDKEHGWDRNLAVSRIEFKRRHQ
ncbi:hypothetical protein GX586_15215 [bacterium]|nr:hypothetical protein [bacterium]